MSQHRKGQPRHVSGWGPPLFGPRMPKRILQSEVQGQGWVRQNRSVSEVSPGEPHCQSWGSLPDDAWGVTLKPTHPPASQFPKAKVEGKNQLPLLAKPLRSLCEGQVRGEGSNRIRSTYFYLTLLPEAALYSAYTPSNLLTVACHPAWHQYVYSKDGVL